MKLTHTEIDIKLTERRWNLLKVGDTETRWHLLKADLNEGRRNLLILDNIN